MELLKSANRSFDFNLGTESGYSVLEIIEKIKQVTGKDVPWEMGPRRPGDPPVLVADSTKARKVLDWSPKFDLTSVVTTAYDWMKKHYAK
jgi:UDP-glucose 4-epimerase